MRKTPLIFAAGILAALIIGDVLEIRFHPDKLAGLPAAVTAAAKDGSLYEKARAQVVTLRRAADKWLIKDDRQRYEIALKYVEEDSARLETQKNPIQAKLLAQSLDRVQDQAESISVDDLTSLKEKTATTLAAAQKTVDSLEDIEAAYENVKSRFAQVKSAIETQVGQLKGVVAGTVDDKEDSGHTEEGGESEIPLKF